MEINTVGKIFKHFHKRAFGIPGVEYNTRTMIVLAGDHDIHYTFRKLDYSKNLGELIKIEWQLHSDGSLDREDGPAFQRFSNGKVISQQWYRNGGRHREDGPAFIEEDCQAWFVNNKCHREDGPARIVFREGKKESESYFTNNILTKEIRYFDNGYTKTKYFEPSGNRAIDPDCYFAEKLLSPNMPDDLQFDRSEPEHKYGYINLIDDDTFDVRADRIAYEDDWYQRQGMDKYTLHLIDGPGFESCAIFARYVSDALDAAVNHGYLDSVIMSQQELQETEEDGIEPMYLGNAGEPIDSDNIQVKSFEFKDLPVWTQSFFKYLLTDEEEGEV